MPHYHFDLINTKSVSNEGGAELSDDIEAMDSADTIARQILDRRPDLKGGHYFILVTDEEGEEIVRVPLDIIH